MPWKVKKPTAADVSPDWLRPYWIRGKGKRHDRMPLPEEAGKAIVDYIQNGRRGSSRTLFVSHRVPYRPWTGGTSP